MENTINLMPGNTQAEKEKELFKRLVARQIVDFKDENITKLRDYAFYQNKIIETIDLSNVISIGNSTFYQCDNLKKVNLPNVTSIGSNCFYQSTISNINIPKVENIYNSAFSACKNIEKIILPKIYQLDGYSFQTSSIKILDCQSYLYKINAGCFVQSSITHLILRGNQKTILQYSAASDIFQYTPISFNEGAVYVPNDLLNDYKNDTNWCTIAGQIYPINIDQQTGEVILIENFDTIKDSWEQIFAAEDNGTYSTKYHIGDTKTVLIDNEPVVMQIVAFDTDNLADNNGKAKITWLSKWLQYTDNGVSYSTNWKTSQFYLELNSPSNGKITKIENTVKNNIKNVVKNYNSDYNITQYANEKLWIPSTKEVGIQTWNEDNGITYNNMFTNDNSRIKFSKNPIIPQVWFLRTRHFRFIAQVGQNSSSYNNIHYYLLGFCT